MGSSYSSIMLTLVVRSLSLQVMGCDSSSWKRPMPLYLGVTWELERCYHRSRLVSFGLECVRLCPHLLQAARLTSELKIAPAYHQVSCSCSPFLSPNSHPGAWTSLPPYLALLWVITQSSLALTICPSLCASFLTRLVSLLFVWGRLLSCFSPTLSSSLDCQGRLFMIGMHDSQQIFGTISGHSWVHVSIFPLCITLNWTGKLKECTEPSNKCYVHSSLVLFRVIGSRNFCM